MKSLMVLEGGSYRGIYTAGVLDVLMGAGLYTDCTLGISAGALNGLGYTAGQIGRCRDVVLDYGLDGRYIGTQALRAEHSLVGFDFILKDLQRILPFDDAAFRNPERKFAVVATSCETGKAVFPERDDYETTDAFLPAIAASCSMPYICHRAKLDGGEYLDGGCAEQLGMTYVEEHTEYDRVIVVLTRRLRYRKKPLSKPMVKLAHKMYGDCPAMLDTLLHVDELYADQRQRLEKLKNSRDLLIIEPCYELGIGRLERSLDNLKLGYENGQRDGENILPAAREFLKGNPDLASGPL